LKTVVFCDIIRKGRKDVRLMPLLAALVIDKKNLRVIVLQ